MHFFELELRELLFSYILNITDGSPSVIRDVIYFIIFDYKLGSHITNSFFYIIKLGGLLIIIGFLWLRFYKIIIDFEQCGGVPGAGAGWWPWV